MGKDQARLMDQQSNSLGHQRAIYLFPNTDFQTYADQAAILDCWCTAGKWNLAVRIMRWD